MSNVIGPRTSFPADANGLRVAIVLVNWNGWRECVECIDSVLAQEHTNYSIYIVDNDSHDSSVEKIHGWCSLPEAEQVWRRQLGVNRYTDSSPRQPVAVRVISNTTGVAPSIDPDCTVTVIRSGGNLGFAGGCNVGITTAGLDGFSYFWFLNPDTTVHRSALVELLSRAGKMARPGILGSTLLYYDNPDTVFALGGGKLNCRNGSGRHIGAETSASTVPEDGSAVEQGLSWICGASMLVSVEFIREIGLMQEDYFLYYEEADWATRGRARFRLGFAPRSIVFHKSGANSSKIMPLYTLGYYYRSRLRYMHRFFPDRIVATKCHLLMEMMRHIIRRRWSAARLIGHTLLWKPSASG